MPSTKSISQSDLSELVDILQTLGIEIRSPHEQMLSEEQSALGNSRAQPPTHASAAPAAEPSPTESTPAEPTPAPSPPAECTLVEAAPAEATLVEAAPAEATLAEAAPPEAAETSPAPNAGNSAPASGGSLLTRAMVIQALLALGVDPVKSITVEPRGTAIAGVTTSTKKSQEFFDGRFWT